MSYIEITGTVVSVSTQWWLKVNNKAFRTGPLDGASFPHIIRVRYTVDGKEYFKKKWLSANYTAPEVGSNINLMYDESRPSKAKILCKT